MLGKKQGQSISFIVPCYNASKTLPLCLESLVKAQSFFEKSEIIVVDNASTDDSPQVALRYRVEVIEEPKRGRSYARNRGAHHAQGQWLAFVDADVVVDEKWALTLLDEMIAKGCKGGQGRIIPSRLLGSKRLNDFRHKSVALATGGSFLLPRRLCMESPMINSAACIYEREIFEKVSGFDPLLERHEDIDLSKRIFMAGGDLCCCEQAFVEVIYHGEGWWDYGLRAYADGKTKMAYFQKWAQWNKNPQQPQLRDTKSSSIVAKIKLATTDALKLLKNALFSPSLFHLLLLIIFILNHWGKLMGMLASSYQRGVTDDGLTWRQQGRIYHGGNYFDLPIFTDHQSFEQHYQKAQEFLW